MSNMLTFLSNDKEKKNKNKLSLKNATMSPQIKPGDKPNKRGRKNGSTF